MAEKECDHTSVGMLVYKGDNLLLIERMKPPFGFAPPAGHVDGDPTFEEAALRELAEEGGLFGTDLELVAEGRKDNPCRRINGGWHYWKIYRVQTEGEVQRSLEETKQAKYFSPEQISKLVARTNNYQRGQITEALWESSPGIEPVWLEWFKELGIVSK